eukprot:PhM_4_TR6334/c0_g1_i1/m.25900
MGGDEQQHSAMASFSTASTTSPPSTPQLVTTAPATTTTTTTTTTHTARRASIASVSSRTSRTSAGEQSISSNSTSTRQPPASPAATNIPASSASSNLNPNSTNSNSNNNNNNNSSFGRTGRRISSSQRSRPSLSAFPQFDPSTIEHPQPQHHHTPKRTLHHIAQVLSARRFFTHSFFSLGFEKEDDVSIRCEKTLSVMLLVVIGITSLISVSVSPAHIPTLVVSCIFLLGFFGCYVLYVIRTCHLHIRRIVALYCLVHPLVRVISVAAYGGDGGDSESEEDVVAAVWFAQQCAVSLVWVRCGGEVFTGALLLVASLFEVVGAMAFAVTQVDGDDARDRVPHLVLHLIVPLACVTIWRIYEDALTSVMKGGEHPNAQFVANVRSPTHVRRESVAFGTPLFLESSDRSFLPRRTSSNRALYNTLDGSARPATAEVPSPPDPTALMLPELDTTSEPREPNGAAISPRSPSTQADINITISGTQQDQQQQPVASPLMPPVHYHLHQQQHESEHSAGGGAPKKVKTRQRHLQQVTIGIISLPHLYEEIRELRAESREATLYRLSAMYMKIVVAAVKKYLGVVIWVCGTEVVVVFRPSETDAQHALSSIVEQLNVRSVGLRPAVALTVGSLSTVRISSYTVGLCSVLERCRSLIRFGTERHISILVDESAYPFLPREVLTLLDLHATDELGHAAYLMEPTTEQPQEHQESSPDTDEASCATGSVISSVATRHLSFVAAAAQRVAAAAPPQQDHHYMMPITLDVPSHPALQSADVDVQLTASVNQDFKQQHSGEYLYNETSNGSAVGQQQYHDHNGNPSNALTPQSSGSHEKEDETGLERTNSIFSVIYTSYKKRQQHPHAKRRSSVMQSSTSTRAKSVISSNDGASSVVGDDDDDTYDFDRKFSIMMPQHTTTISDLDHVDRGASLDPLMLPLISTMNRKSVSLGAQPAPPGMPPDVWDVWRLLDTDGTGELDAEQTWNLLERLSIPMDPDKYYEFLQVTDVDGSCTVSVEEFITAYHGPVLGGLVLKAEITRTARSLYEHGRDPFAEVLSEWRALDKDQTGVLAFADALDVLKKFDIDADIPRVAYLCREIEGIENDSREINMESLVTLFVPELDPAEVDFRQRVETVTRVMSGQGSKLYTTDEQLNRDDATVLRQRYDAVTCPILFIYAVYTIMETPILIPLWDNQEVSSTMMERFLVYLVSNIIPMAWIASKFFMPRERSGVLLYKQHDIRQDYLFSTEAVVDALMILPTEIIPLAYSSIPWPELFRVNKLLMLYHFGALFDLLTARLNPTVTRLTKTALTWIILIQFCAAGFLLVVRGETDESMQGMMGEDNTRFTELGVFDLYVQAFDFAAKTMVGLSRGEPVPPNDNQVLISLVTVLVGVMAYAVIVSTIATVLNVRDSAAIFTERMDELGGFFGYAKIPRDVQIEIFGYYAHVFATVGTTSTDDDPLSDLPSELRVRIRVQSAVNLLHRVYVFRDVINCYEFMHEVMNAVVQRTVMPGAWLSRHGDVCVEMVSVLHGELWRYVDERQVQYQPLLPGDYFGDIGLLHNVRAVDDVQCHATRYANVLVLNKMDFGVVLHSFPEVHQRMTGTMRSRIHKMLRRQPSVPGDALAGGGRKVSFFGTSGSSTSLHLGSGGSSSDSFDELVGSDGEGTWASDVDQWLTEHSVREDSDVASIHRAWCDKLAKSNTFGSFRVPH